MYGSKVRSNEQRKFCFYIQFLIKTFIKLQKSTNEFYYNFLYTFCLNSILDLLSLFLALFRFLNVSTETARCLFLGIFVIKTND
jgi:hypothetical protein